MSLEYLKDGWYGEHDKLVRKLLAVAEAASSLCARWEGYNSVGGPVTLTLLDPHWRPVMELSLVETLKGLKDE